MLTLLPLLLALTNASMTAIIAGRVWAICGRSAAVKR